MSSLTYFLDSYIIHGPGFDAVANSHSTALKNGKDAYILFF